MGHGGSCWGWFSGSIERTFPGALAAKGTIEWATHSALHRASLFAHAVSSVDDGALLYLTLAGFVFFFTDIAGLVICFKSVQLLF